MQTFKLSLTQEEVNTIHLALLEYVHRLTKYQDNGTPGFLEEVKDTSRAEVSDANALRVKLPRYYRPE